MGEIFNVLLLQTTLRSATPVVLAAMGCLMTQHVNITNIGIDGMMLIGAFFGVLGSYFFGSWAAGLGLAILCGILLGLFYYVFVIKFGSDEFIIGVALNIFAGGLTVFLLRTVFQVKGAFSDPALVPLPTVQLPFFDLNIPEAADGIRSLMRKQNFNLYFNDQPVLRKTGYCKFVREGMTFVRSDGSVSPCMALLHNGYTYLHDIRRKITHCSFGNVKEQPLAEIWNSKEYKAFRRKFDEFDFASCLYCGHCELFAENKEDCIGNTHPTCGGCLWAEGVLSCP